MWRTSAALLSLVPHFQKCWWAQVWNQDWCLHQTRVVGVHLLSPGPLMGIHSHPSRSPPRAAHPPGENPPFHWAHECCIYRILFQEVVLLCAVCHLPATDNAVTLRWNGALVFRGASALSHAVCCSFKPPKRCWSVFYEYRCEFRKSDLNIAACFPGKPGSCILTAAKAAPYAQHSQPFPRDRLGLVVLHLACIGFQNKGLLWRKGGGAECSWCLQHVQMCCSGAFVQHYMLWKLDMALSNLI